MSKNPIIRPSWGTRIEERQGNLILCLRFPPDNALKASQLTFVPPEDSSHEARTNRTYRPLPSVWKGENAFLLEQMLRFYPRSSTERILDATVGGWRFWRNSSRPVLGMDMKLRNRPNVVGDDANMPFRSAIFDVVIYDPPHVPNQGKDDLKDFTSRFDSVFDQQREWVQLLIYLSAVSREAHEILRPEGILLCKVTDYVHDHRYQWAHVDLIKSTKSFGSIACDCLSKSGKDLS